jgi:hypothetical protein
VAGAGGADLTDHGQDDVSLAYAVGQFAVDRDVHVLGLLRQRLGGKTCSTSDVPMPKLRAEGPCVEVWLSPQTMVLAA